jgi:hypothetical protein
MAQLRVRVELQRPDKGIEMSKLADLSRETQKLLRMVAEDAGLVAADGTWVARDFYNQGVGFDAEYQFADVDPDEAVRYTHLMDQITVVDRDTNWTVRGVRAATLVQSARVATLASEGETVRLGLYNGVPDKFEWRPMRKDLAAAILEHYESWVEYRGMLQGVIHSLHKESNPPFFDLRDFATRALVKCIFKPEDYEIVHKALERKTGVVLVSGWIRAKRLDKAIAEIRIERIQPTKPINAQQLRDFFGSAPGWTGDLSTDQFIDLVRGTDDGDE